MAYIQSCFIFITTLLVLSGNASAAIYKWKDEAGQVHYGSVPPQGIKSQRMGVSTAYTPTPAKKTTKSDSKKAAASGEKEPADADKKDKYTQQQHDTLCKNARKDLATMNQAGRLRVKQDDGSTAVMSDQDRQKRMKTMQAMAAKHCK